jgi:protoporphyrin/coproporphyrin ferrochelatase
LSAFRAEPEFAHDTPETIGVVLVNLGTPDAPTPAAVRRYLREFLSDRRVVEIPRLLWMLILHGVILRVRPRKSATKYASIWMKEGSPLAVHTARQAQLVRGWLGERTKAPLVVTHAMRYGNPSIASVLDELKKKNATRVLIVPLYPQYAASTTATVVDEVTRFYAGTRNVPALRFVRGFATHPAYISALTDLVRAHWARRPERLREKSKLLMSFHGLPAYTLQKGDPYHCECHATARALAESLGLARDAWQLTFQSRFGRAEWLKPYTATTLSELGTAGLDRLDVVTPGFVADCLETLEEIAIEGKELYEHAGGKGFAALVCLNEDPAWIRALGQIVTEELAGWLPANHDARATAQTLAARRERAVKLGATR